ncbi:uncharacterized protein LOC130684201 [Manis pentadactyla]|uniref:uncharacterized protein LOC130684201 n=1 Tax=Manis pentadactyla TaxID=143292 RepID=UPI00255C7F54|nr:uncharacterized protein LOC130684201 [Manis pentadactyla]
MRVLSWLKRPGLLSPPRGPPESLSSQQKRRGQYWWQSGGVQRPGQPCSLHSPRHPLTARAPSRQNLLLVATIQPDRGEVAPPALGQEHIQPVGVQGALGRPLTHLPPESASWASAWLPAVRQERVFLCPGRRSDPRKGAAFRAASTPPPHCGSHLNFSSPGPRPRGPRLENPHKANHPRASTSAWPHLCPPPVAPAQVAVAGRRRGTRSDREQPPSPPGPRQRSSGPTSPSPLPGRHRRRRGQPSQRTCSTSLPPRTDPLVECAISRPPAGPGRSTTSVGRSPVTRAMQYPPSNLHGRPSPAPPRPQVETGVPAPHPGPAAHRGHVPSSPQSRRFAFILQLGPALDHPP